MGLRDWVCAVLPCAVQQCQPELPWVLLQGTEPGTGSETYVLARSRLWSSGSEFFVLIRVWERGGRWG